MTEHPLVTTIRDAVHVHPRPCVNISGGIDSTIILHHLTEKCDEDVSTYTVGFPERDEFRDAARVAQHYGVKHHTEIVIRDMLETFRDILRGFPQPRFNLWPYWLAERQHRDGDIRSCYIGEGGDEHFGGYWYKPRKHYLEYWSGFFTYVYPTYQTIYDMFGIQLVAPMHPSNLRIDDTLSYFDHAHEKALLRNAYTGVLPDFVLNKRKRNGRMDYYVMWRREMQPYFPKAHPQSEEDIRQLLNVWVTREWSRLHDVEPVEVAVVM